MHKEHWQCIAALNRSCWQAEPQRGCPVAEPLPLTLDNTAATSGIFTTDLAAVMGELDGSTKAEFVRGQAYSGKCCTLTDMWCALSASGSSRLGLFCFLACPSPYGKPQAGLCMFKTTLHGDREDCTLHVGTRSLHGVCRHFRHRHTGFASLACVLASTAQRSTGGKMCGALEDSGVPVLLRPQNHEMRPR